LLGNSFIASSDCHIARSPPENRVCLRVPVHSDSLDGLVQLLLTSACDENMSAFLNEQLRGS
jgi:hypothetical protein